MSTRNDCKLVVDWYDAFILDIGWFCHSKKVVIPGTEDLVDAYKDYGFHINGSFIGMLLFNGCSFFVSHI